MKCSCGADTIVKDSRIISEGQWRKRYCSACGTPFTTLEQVCETLMNSHPTPKGGHEIRIVKPAIPEQITWPKRERKRAARHQIEDMKLERKLNKEKDL